MERDQALEWFAAQQITISEDLVAVAKNQLAFLAVVNKHRSLYEGPLLDRAIHRYKACWLPLLAKFTETGATKGFLIVPLDCEWIWHVHRLNPVQYKEDCEKLFGRTLDNKNVKSSLQVRPESKDLMAKWWNKVFPMEPFELDLTTDDSAPAYKYDDDKGITYDLVAAVERQSSFYHHVSGATMKNDRFLDEALARYKGFLHLIKKNQPFFCVPTYDIDLLWHSHQLQPVSYCKDTVALLGRLLQHDEADAGADAGTDANQEIELESAFSETRKQWECLYGWRYWRAGATFKDYKPSPVLVSPYQPNSEIKNKTTSPENNKYINLVQLKFVEVLLQVVRVKDLPETQQGNLFVAFGKQQHDFFLSGSYVLKIQSETEDQEVASFQCEATGDLVLTLVADSRSNFARSVEPIGQTSISIDKLAGSNSTLFLQDWLQLRTSHQSESAEEDTNPISILVAISVSVPVPAPYAFYMVKGKPMIYNSCFLVYPGMISENYWTHFIHGHGNEIISLKIRDSTSEIGQHDKTNKKEVIGMTRFNRKPRVLAEFEDNAWSLKDSNLVLILKKKIGEGGDIFEIKGDKQIKLFLGKKLEYEPENNNMDIDEEYITAVEFSADHPYGKALALLGIKSGTMKVNEGWFALPAVVLALIISELFENEGFGTFILNETAVVLASCGVMARCKSSIAEPRCRTSLAEMFAGNGCKRARFIASLAGYKARRWASVADGNGGNGGHGSASCITDVGDGGAEFAAMARCKAGLGAESEAMARCKAGLGAESEAMARCKAGLGAESEAMARCKAGLSAESAAMARCKAGLGAESAAMARCKAGLGAESAAMVKCKAGLSAESGTMPRCRAGQGAESAAMARCKEGLSAESAAIARCKAGLGAESAGMARCKTAIADVCKKQ
ncbi:putative Glycine-rich domain-containing protein [Dioscorea sansibarensis]